MSKKDFKFKYLDKVPNQFRHANESFTITEISSSVSNFQKKKRNDMVALNIFKQPQAGSFRSIGSLINSEGGNCSFNIFNLRQI